MVADYVERRFGAAATEARREPVDELSCARRAAPTTSSGEELRRHRKVAETGRELARRYGYSEIATPIFEFTDVFAAHAGRHLGRRHQGDVHLRGPRRRPAHAAAREHGRRGARGDHRRPDPAPAAQVLLRRPDVPLRAAAEGPAAPVPPDRHRADRRAASRMADVEVIALGPHILEALGVGRERDARAQHAGRPGEPRRLPRGAGRLPRGSPGPALAGQPRPARAQPAAHPRQQGRGRPRGPGRGAAVRAIT